MMHPVFSMVSLFLWWWTNRIIVFLHVVIFAKILRVDLLIGEVLSVEMALSYYYSVLRYVYCCRAQQLVALNGYRCTDDGQQ